MNAAPAAGHRAWALPARVAHALAVVAAVVLAGAALALAALHPRWPLLAVGGVLGLMALVAWRPVALAGLWPALVPVLSFMPWTGWTLVDESDLLVLATLAGAYARWPAAPGVASSPAPAVGLALAGVLGLVTGLSDAPVGLAGAWNAAVHASPADAWNVVRVSKPLLWLCLLLPLWPRLGPRAPAWLAGGLVAELAGVCATVLAERAAMVGLLDVDTLYRTSAGFWEMHVGGGAIDMALALGLPWSVWALWRARSPLALGAAVLLAWAAVYAVLTTYSRGVIVASAVVLVAMAWSACRWRPAAAAARRGAFAVLVLGAAVGVQGTWVASGDLIAQRLARGPADALDRLAHWRHALALLDTPARVLLGLGAGRFPARYEAATDGVEWPGQARARAAAEGGGLWLLGPLRREDLAGRWSVAQRVGSLAAGPYRVHLSGTGPVPDAAVCERHLLQAERCWPVRWNSGPASAATAADGRDGVVALPRATRPGGGPWVEFVLRAGGPGEQALITGVSLSAPDGRPLLRNGDFADGLRHWMVSAQGYFQPWHVDNLYMEVLVERGVAGLALLLAALAASARGLYRRAVRGDAWSWAALASLGSVALLGTVISVTEFPRVALLLGLLCCVSGPERAEIGERIPGKRL